MSVFGAEAVRESRRDAAQLATPVSPSFRDALRPLQERLRRDKEALLSHCSELKDRLTSEFYPRSPPASPSNQIRTTACSSGLGRSSIEAKVAMLEERLEQTSAELRQLLQNGVNTTTEDIFRISGRSDAFMQQRHPVEAPRIVQPERDSVRKRESNIREHDFDALNAARGTWSVETPLSQMMETRMQGPEEELSLAKEEIEELSLRLKSVTVQRDGAISGARQALSAAFQARRDLERSDTKGARTAITEVLHWLTAVLGPLDKEKGSEEYMASSNTESTRIERDCEDAIQPWTPATLQNASESRSEDRDKEITQLSARNRKRDEASNRREVCSPVSPQVLSQYKLELETLRQEVEAGKRNLEKRLLREAV